MTISGYGISGIGYNPLGTLGLGSTGQYASYDAYMPSMMGMNYGMNNSVFPMASVNGIGGMSGINAMYGMYNPMFMANMQQQMEASQAIHNNNMHNILLNNEIAAHNHTDKALIQKMLTNGDIKQQIQNLYDKVKEGDQDGICNEFDKLKNFILNNYRDEFAAKGFKINPSVAATECIEALYGNIISAQNGGQVHDLRSDIKRYGDGAFENGFNSGFKRGHHGRYVDETLNHCFDLDIDQKGSKDMQQSLANGVGRTASVLQKGAYGAAAGVGAATLGCGLIKFFGSPLNLKPFTKFGKTAWVAAALGAAAGMAADIWWQASNA
ncbi:hypothetical protein IJ384_01235 [bacterium]|nr:hypothetical protein [bacterium]